MHAPSARPTRRTVTLTALSAVVLLAAALVLVPGVFPAAATGVLTCLIALTQAVRDAVIAVVLESALVVIAIGASTGVLLSVTFMVAIAVGVAAAIRMGRGTLALVMAAQLALVLTASEELGMPRSAIGFGGVILASGLLVCAGAIFVVRWSNESVSRAPRPKVIHSLVLLAPVIALMTWSTVTVLDATRGWGLAAFLIALAVGGIPGRSLARLLAVISGAFLAALVVTVFEGVPILIAIPVVLLAGGYAGTRRTLLLATALTAAVLLVGASSIAASDTTRPDSLLAAVTGAFLAWVALSVVSWLAGRKARLTNAQRASLMS